jgi:pimeloyl-ACP methyl ester carboxylesterase
MWASQIAEIGKSYRVIAPDLRGHGDSPAPAGVYTMDEMADDIIELLDQLQIKEPVVVGGLSMGGYVALSLVLRHPERFCGLILIDSRAAADAPEAARVREETARAVVHEGSSRSMLETMVPRLFGKTTREKHPERIEPMLAVMERTTPQGIAGALRGMAVRPDRRGDLGKIKVPTLVMVGEEDVISPPAEAREMADLFPASRLEVIPNAGHLTPYENPQATNAAITRFLEHLDRSATTGELTP